MTIGLTFPVKDNDEIKSVPWGLMEMRRERAIKNHGLPLERLAALGGLPLSDIGRILLDRDVGTGISDTEAAQAAGRHNPVDDKPEPEPDEEPAK